MPRTTRSAAVAITAAIVTSAALVGAAPTASARTPKLTTAGAVRLVTQQGLAIAMASNVLQSQLEYLLMSEADGGVGKCSRLEGGGSDKIVKRSSPSKTRTVLTNAIYYDTKCKTPYITQTGTVVRTSKASNATVSAKYVSPAGQQLGVLKTHASAINTAKGEDLLGTGMFDPAGSQRPVALGLSCQIDTNGSDSTLPCQGAIAQNFPALKQSLASVTPLVLELNDKSGSLTFAGAKNTRRSGKIGALSVGTTAKHVVTISGKGAPAGSAATKGKAGGFALFPPTPTGWLVTDAADHVTFAISVVSNTTRALKGTVKSTAGTTLASFSLDRSGTGTISYRTGSKSTKAPVHSWILAG